VADEAVARNPRVERAKAALERLTAEAAATSCAVLALDATVAEKRARERLQHSAQHAIAKAKQVSVNVEALVKSELAGAAALELLPSVLRAVLFWPAFAHVGKCTAAGLHRASYAKAICLLFSQLPARRKHTQPPPISQPALNRVASARPF
jgi:hypothetical protein